MTVKEDALRALEYGKGTYYQTITSFPSYQAELARVRTDYNERTWIDFTGFFPKFTTEEFEQRRTAYQAKYGTTVNIPGFADVIHLAPKAKISAEERAAHLWATKRGLPSPLTPAQLETMKYKKFRFINALASATPGWMKTYGAVATVLDNVEDGLITIVVLGRLIVRIAPRLLGAFVSKMGWLLLGSDILNAVNIISWASAMRGGCKGLHGSWHEKNPFHAKAAARRALKLKRTIPTFGEILEILQTTDQLFGVGVCLGGIMGMVIDTATKALDAISAEPIQPPEKGMPMPFEMMKSDYLKEMHRVLWGGNVNDIASWASKGAMNDFDVIKYALQQQFYSFKDEAYRLKATDQQLREDVQKWIGEQSKKAWEWIKTVPESASSYYSDPMIGAMILSTGMDDFLKEDHTKAFMMLDATIQGLMPWWIENDPISNFKDLRNWKFRAPAPKDLTTVDMLTEHNKEWEKAVMWPHLNQEYATIEEIAFTYAPKIKESFQTYCLKYQHEWETYAAASQAVDFVKNVIRSYDDDHEVKIGYTAWIAVGIDMMDQIYIMEPDTPDQMIGELADYIGNYERQTALAPNIKDVVRTGENIGIKWMRSFPERAFHYATEPFPEWGEIQDQLDELYRVD